jgi:DNA repair protein RecO (recombination protein O)
MPTARQPRVHDEPAFVLHRHDWSESSLILDVFSRHHGRIALAAKGVKRPSSQFRPVLLPMQPLRLGWTGETEVRSLKSAHWQGGHVMPVGEALLAGFYLNELLLRVLAREDPHPRLFDHYTEAVRMLAAAPHAAPQRAAVLRAFELLLLRDSGVLPDLAVEGASLTPLQPHGLYQLRPQEGLRERSGGAVQACAGAYWLALGQALQAAEPWPALLALGGQDRGALQVQLRQLLHYHSGVSTFQTRRLVVEAQRLRSVTASP